MYKLLFEKSLTISCTISLLLELIITFSTIHLLLHLFTNVFLFDNLSISESECIMRYLLAILPFSGLKSCSIEKSLIKVNILYPRLINSTPL